MFQKILIANRGEIAVRIIRACREMGIQTVAVYSTADKEALHTQLADEAICIGSAPALDSYLQMERILSATIASGAEAIHPGFGFLSENGKFVRMCEACKIAFIGPTAEVIERMGDKAEARRTMENVGVPVVPGIKESILEAEKGMELAEKIGYPIMIKAAFGGGGKGMRVVVSKEDFKKEFQVAQQEAISGFGNGTMYLERFVENPRHIEVQILADTYGDVIQLGERECSIQRRHQKLIEESPSAAITQELREKMGLAAVRAAKACGYINAGTIEFLLDKTGEFFFMEMNTRIQVEHGVTEMVTGMDLIKEQIRITAGERLSHTQEQVILRGHAIECRINAEDPSHNFRPSPGTIQELHFPGGNGIRVDSALFRGYKIPPNYDSMIGKVMVHDDTRLGAIKKMQSALGEIVVEGVITNRDYQYEIISHPVFQSGAFDTGFIEQYMEGKK